MTLELTVVGAEAAADVVALIHAGFGARPPIDPPSTALEETLDSVAEALASLGTNHGVVGEGKVALGMSNSCSFLRPITAGSIHATARRRHRGRTTWIWDVELTDDDGRLCALGRVTVAVRTRPQE